jgi:hypothetical protein
MSPLSLSDSEPDVILSLMQPIDPELRDPFLRAVAIELARYRTDATGGALVANCSGNF